MDKKNIDAITKLGRKFSDTTLLMHENIAAKAGLSGADHKYLGILIQHGAMTAGQLSKLSGLTTGAVTGVIDRLEKKKLVKRELGKDDRRKIMIVPHYENVMKLLGGVFSELQTKMVNLMDNFTEEETKIIEKYLLASIEAMDEIIASIHSKK